ncbi:MAG: hypothetical protein Q9219_002823 [cf. Caloplaca sp. 3 TL-2023]
MKPDIQQVDSRRHLCYNEIRRIHTAKAYPFAAPNGSTILLLGVENGLQILRRGGRPVEDHPPECPWTDDGTLNQSDTAEASFEPDGKDYDSSHGAEHLVDALDLPLGTAVVHIAFPHLPSDSLQHGHGSLPNLLIERITAAVVCSDASTRLVMLPLAPPSTSTRRNAKTSQNLLHPNHQNALPGDRSSIILGGTNHQSIPKCISLTLAPPCTPPASDSEMDEDDIPSDPRGRRQHPLQPRSRSSSTKTREGWDLLVASCSTNLLVIHRIPLSPDGVELDLTAANHNIPWAIQYLPSPPSSLHFHPSLPPDERNCRLLVAEKKGIVRILDCHPDDPSGQCTSIVTLYPDSRPSPSPVPGIRKRQVLDAQWVLGGKAVLTLLADGEWGIWDLEGSGPKPRSGTRASEMPTFGSFFTFAITGSVSSDSHSLKTINANPATKTGSKTAPLGPTTPSTRRLRQENLFSGPLRRVDGPSHGGVDVLASQDLKGGDETILLWNNDDIIVLPSLQTHWANRVKGHGNLFGDGAKGEAKTISRVSLKGERRTGVVLVPRLAAAGYDGSEVLVTGESRFVIVSETVGKGGREVRGRVGTSFSEEEEEEEDHTMLERGDLDLEGMDRVLEGMSGKRVAPQAGVGPPQPRMRKVGFVEA